MASPSLHFRPTAAFDDDAADIPISDDELRALQSVLIANPRAGYLVPQTRGLRKLRLGVKGKGKRGGARVLYYYVARRSTVYLLFAYDKTVSADLTAFGKQHLAQLAALLAAEKED